VPLAGTHGVALGWATTHPSRMKGHDTAGVPTLKRHSADCQARKQSPVGRSMRNHSRTMPSKTPEQLARETISRGVSRAFLWLVDRGRRYVSGTVLYLLGTATAGTVLALTHWSLLPAALCGVAVVLMGGYIIFSHKLLQDERTMRQWAHVQGKRAQQDIVERDLLLDKAVLALIGEPQDRMLRLKARPAELAQALRVVQHRLAESRAAQRPQPTSARQRRPAPPSGPDLEVVRKRIAAREAEHAQLEAEIQALATPDDIAADMAAAEARRAARSVKDAARRASQAARERKRRGLPATQRRGSLGLELGVRPNGRRHVRKLPPESTPEQIAQGEASEPAEDPRGRVIIAVNCELCP
jgi:hypothetical protein